MDISEHWFTFKNDVLRQRHLFTGTVEEGRIAYQATFDSLTPLCPKPEEWEVNDRMFNELDGPNCIGDIKLNSL